uniref:Uncharacterized protein n=1 Tax=Romanomermis culicivorax TaxID=13658 RepID=A0A915J0W5_ROMCU
MDLTKFGLKDLNPSSNLKYDSSNFTQKASCEFDFWTPVKVPLLLIDEQVEESEKSPADFFAKQLSIWSSA